MTHRTSTGFQSANRTARLSAGFLLVLAFACPARADRQIAAREQFETAVRMRTMLEGYLEKDRTLADYKQTIAAYEKVVAISPLAEEATSSLIAEAELYREMGRLYDPRYFQTAINTYNFLLSQYPGTRYRTEAMLAIAEIQKEDMNDTSDAEAGFKNLVKRYPRSAQANDARQELAEISAQRQKKIDEESDLEGQAVQPRVSARGFAHVTDIRAWNTEDYTRIVVTLDETIEYEASHIFSPDRIFFDLRKASVSGKVAEKAVSVDSGLLKSVRVGQNKPDTVRLVLDVSGAKNYSAVLLGNPYRLVIDVSKEPLPAAGGVLNAAAGPARSAAADPAPAKALEPGEVVTVDAGDSAPVAAPGAAVSKAPANPIFMPKPVTKTKSAVVQPMPEPPPTRDGERSMTRALGLKINRIVIDAGHGGYDTGTVGPHGLMEKDLCLDVALRLGRVIEQKLPGAEVVYTRRDDTFIPLEERTAIANRAKADLFISIHANSSHDPAARGVETYYLNFDTSPESMEVAARENERSNESLHDLQDLLQKIARNDKIEESKEFASDVQDALTQRLQLVSHSERNRGVKKAPFVVLIGAEMPSVLAEISFVSNPTDERMLRRPDQRQRIADGLYRGIATYLDSLNSLQTNKKLVSANRAASPGVTPAGNPK